MVRGVSFALASLLLVFTVFPAAAQGSVEDHFRGKTLTRDYSDHARR